MGSWHVRDLVAADLEALIRLDDESSTTRQPPVFTLADVVAALGSHPAVVAVADGQLIGAALSRVDSDRAWVLRLSLSPAWRGQGLGSDLLAALEQRLLTLGVSRIGAVLPAGETGSTAFANSGFAAREGVTYFEKSELTSPASVRLLNELGAVVPNARLWHEIAGMAAEKDVIERTLILPLSHPDTAADYGVDPPRAVILFGPPGTGKTTFARAVAGRLGWPFLELFPSRLAAPAGIASGLNQAFTDIAALEHVVVFIDEVEEIASARTLADTDVGVVNELLKGLVSFRAQAGRLFICATNSIRTIDPAFLRHGRFDYVLPIGPPDTDARRALWATYGTASEPGVALGDLADASAGFTPADIRHAAQRVAQRRLEAALSSGKAQGVTTSDYLTQIDVTRPTLTSEAIAEFEEDTTAHARV